jgi:hypothetical protein
MSDFLLGGSYIFHSKNGTLKSFKKMLVVKYLFKWKNSELGNARFVTKKAKRSIEQKSKDASV